MGATQAAIVIATIAGSGSDAADVNQSIGFWDGTTVISQNCVIEDGPVHASGNATQSIDNAKIIELQNVGGSGVVERSATISAAPGGNGIRLTWGGTIATYAPYVMVILINGCTGVKVGNLLPSGTDDGTATETSMGITPKVIFGITNSRNVGDGLGAGANQSMGIAFDTGSGIEQVSHYFGRSDNSTTTRLRINTLAASDPAAATFNSGPTPYGCFEVTAMASGEFTLATRVYSGGSAGSALNSDFCYLALDFAEDAAIIDTTMTTATTTDFVPLTGASFTPTFAFMLPTRVTVEDANVTSGDGAIFQGYYAVSDDAEYQLGMCYETDAATNANSSGRTETFLFGQDSAAGAPVYKAANPTFASGSITYSYLDSDFTEAAGAYHIVGVAFGAGGVIPQIMHNRLQQG
jgi:hypothetical protein